MHTRETRLSPHPPGVLAEGVKGEERGSGGGGGGVRCVGGVDTAPATAEETAAAEAAEKEETEAVGPPECGLLMRNKAPRWHDELQCWCLDFQGRVTQASVKK